MPEVRALKGRKGAKVVVYHEESQCKRVLGLGFLSRLETYSPFQWAFMNRSSAHRFISSDEYLKRLSPADRSATQELFAHLPPWPAKESIKVKGDIVYINVLSWRNEPESSI